MSRVNVFITYHIVYLLKTLKINVAVWLASMTSALARYRVEQIFVVFVNIHTLYDRYVKVIAGKTRPLFRREADVRQISANKHHHFSLFKPHF